MTTTVRRSAASRRSAARETDRGSAIGRAALTTRPQGNGFRERYHQRYKQEIGLYAPYFYDGVMVIAAAMQKAGSSEPEKYLTALRQIRHPGVTADIEFDANGELKHPRLSIFRVHGGKWVLQP